jgi:hypothetical protein
MMMIMKMVAVYITFNFLYILGKLIFMLYFTNHFLHADVQKPIDVFTEVTNSVKLPHTHCICDVTDTNTLFRFHENAEG